MVSNFISKLALWAYDHAKLFLMLLGLLVAGSIWSIKSLTFDMSNEGSLRPTNPVRVAYNDFKTRFGRDDYVLVVVDLEKARKDGMSFNQAYQGLDTLKQDIESHVPYIDEIDSFSNIRYTFSKNDALYTEDLIESYESGLWSGEEDFLKFSTNHPLYKNRFISENARYIALNIKFKDFIAPVKKIDLLSFDSDAVSDSDDNKPVKVDSFKMGDALKVLVDRVDSSPFKAHISGAPYLVDELNKITITGSSLTGGGAIIFSMLLMWFFFRRMVAVVTPVIILMLSLIFTLALKSLFNVPYTLFTGVITPLMIAISISDSVHILAKFYKEYEVSGDKRSAVGHSISFSAKAILLTSLTTSVGFLSFALGDIESLAMLGVFTAVAVMTAFILSVTLIPAILSLAKVERNNKSATLFASLERFLEGCADFSIKYSRGIMLFTLVAFIGLGFNAKNLIFSHDNVAILNEESRAKIDYNKINKQFKAINPVEIMIDTQHDDGVFNLQLLQGMERAENELAEKDIQGIYLAKPYSIISIVKEINMALQANQDTHYRLPNDLNLIKQELNLFESSAKDDLFDVVDEGFRYLRTTISIEHADGVLYNKVLPQVKAVYEKHLPNDVRIVMTGDTALVADTVPSALDTMVKSYITALFFITLFIVLIVRNVKLGLISLIPNILPILFVMNLMVWLDWKLDLTTIMVGAIAIGIVVDDTLHFLHRYRENTLLGLSVEASIRDTMLTTGRALLITTIVFSIAGAANTLSPLPNFVVFGFTLSIATVLALFADFIITPAFIVGFTKGKKA